MHKHRTRGKRWLSALALGATLALGTTALPGTASAQQFQYQLNNRTQTDGGKPSLELVSPNTIKGATVLIERSDGHKKTVKLGNLKLGERRTIVLDQPRGKFGYTVTISGKDIDNDDIDLVLTFDAAWVDPIKIDVDIEKVDLGTGQLPFVSNRPVARADIEVFDADGKKVLERTQAFDGRSGALVATWNAVPEVGGVRMTVHDSDGFWAGVILEPFWVEIPHQTIIFNFGKATWDASEEPKLRETLGHIREAMEKHAHKGLEMQLYIAAYTDTVGSAESNMKLSTERAHAIARWFRQNGLRIAVYYQGFGESVLAVPTPDETPEERNRRAVYILGNAPPPTSTAVPKQDWRRVR